MTSGSPGSDSIRAAPATDSLGGPGDGDGDGDGQAREVVGEAAAPVRVVDLSAPLPKLSETSVRIESQRGSSTAAPLDSVVSITIFSSMAANANRVLLSDWSEVPRFR